LEGKKKGKKEKKGGLEVVEVQLLLYSITSSDEQNSRKDKELQMKMDSKAFLTTS